MLKRLFDITFSSLGLLLCLPLFVVIALLIKLDSRGPVFFKHERVGKGFVPFHVYKFRTMVSDAVQKGPSLTSAHDSRITSAGRLLRKTKLDELPQLWNVLKGEMSFVGPRPEVPKYVTMFNEEYNDILKVKPGITDYASIDFRNEEKVLSNYSDPEEGYIKEVLPAKIALYRKYVSKQGFFTDIRLILLTLMKITFMRDRN
jgi:lipopolysaccharide/colanic/teichoic acid biosynthesis glycosyltransferase